MRLVVWSCALVQNEEKEVTDVQLQRADEEIVDPIVEDDDLDQPIRYTISSYGADMPVDGLVKRLDQEHIFIPEFQRKYVWSVRQASRFIESLLLDLPIPGIFLFKEPETQRLMVVDGQQRLLTLQRFYKGLFRERAFKLTGVSEEFRNRKYEDLYPEDQRRLDDSIIHATIFQQVEPGNDQSSVYAVFERLNTGGTQLSPQEIRSCIYRGELNDLLGELNGNPHWRSLYGTESQRKKDEEIILRFLGLFFYLERYRRPMKVFLNDFMEEFRRPGEQRVQEFRDTFEKTVEVADTVLTPNALRPERALNVSVVDAVLVGLAHRLRKGAILDYGGLKSRHDQLLTKLRDGNLYNVGTTDDERVKMRIGYACDAYGEVR